MQAYLLIFISFVRDVLLFDAFGLDPKGRGWEV